MKPKHPTPHYLSAIGVSMDCCSEIYPGTQTTSEPEAQAVTYFVGTRLEDFLCFLTIHSYGQLLLLPYGHPNFTAENYNELVIFTSTRTHLCAVCGGGGDKYTGEENVWRCTKSLYLICTSQHHPKHWKENDNARRRSAPLPLPLSSQHISHSPTTAFVKHIYKKKTVGGNGRCSRRCQKLIFPTRVTENQPQKQPGIDVCLHTAHYFLIDRWHIGIRLFCSPQMEVGRGAADAILKVHGMNYTVGTSPDVLCECLCVRSIGRSGCRNCPQEEAASSNSILTSAILLLQTPTLARPGTGPA